MPSGTEFSIQQIKFEFLSYLKEFGGNGRDWFIGCAEAPPEDDDLGATTHVPDEAIWIRKPALSARAARMVRDHMVSRHQVQAAPGLAGDESGRWIYMYRLKPEDRLPLVETRPA